MHHSIGLVFKWCSGIYILVLYMSNAVQRRLPQCNMDLQRAVLPRGFNLLFLDTLRQECPHGSRRMLGPTSKCGTAANLDPRQLSESYRKKREVPSSSLEYTLAYTFVIYLTQRYHNTFINPNLVFCGCFM